VENAIAADGVKYCSRTSACIADISGSGMGSGSQFIEEHMLKGDEVGEGQALEIELWRECRGEDRGERGEGGVFMSPSRASKAIASVRKCEAVQVSRVRA